MICKLRPSTCWVEQPAPTASSTVIARASPASARLDYMAPRATHARMRRGYPRDTPCQPPTPATEVVADQRHRLSQSQPGGENRVDIDAASRLLRSTLVQS